MASKAPNKRGPRSFASDQASGREVYFDLPAAIRRILVPIDFSYYSRRALHSAVTLAGQLHARIYLLYVGELDDRQGLPPNEDAALRANLQEMAQQQMTRLRKLAISPSIVSHGYVRFGRPHVEILTGARELKADLIVMAAHSKDTHACALGSTARHVSAQSLCPVLLVPGQEHRR